MKKKLLFSILIIMCLILSGCQSSNDEEIEKIGNLINGT